MSFVETEDHTALFYKDWGSGRPVLFLHSWAVNSDMWEPHMVPLVEAGFRCVAFDRRGHGCSGRPGDGYDFDTFADDLALIIDQLDLTDITLVGHSMGAGEIVRYLTRHGSDRVARVLMLAPTLPFLLKTDDNPDGIERACFDEVRAVLLADTPKWLVDNAEPFFLPRTTGVSPEMMRCLIEQCLQSGLKAKIDTNRSVTETDFRRELAEIDVPTLIIHGDSDVSAPLAFTAERTAALIPGSRLVIYEGAPHGLFVTHRERFMRDLMAFLEG
ncbi:MAG TPA: alpha/beta hydrolase [Aliidongia sp.]|uniref:alpha/beta fold hydrolase n=1 Tax=Aliidongia sp. TaxID=1914230 RepID=UPI002DDD394A|nr:alpha/beta hydrolase [Aliidongia sp.]HEV2675263.1 alpha/beta hydrolase [Aliidongia sp.]